ncbi:hypothetical protein EYF80_040775 [Liparis tanakae]|uniref:Uncharacterized protein n=1 Tax=Liparis tanakae TaxID=230148 RepID=A0A4Z2G7V1_9TELE|nr:hypothetical protein EYF80_040775 [Liparis tanakae]
METACDRQGSAAAGRPVRDTLHTRPAAVLSPSTPCVQPLEAVFSEEIETQPKNTTLLWKEPSQLRRPHSILSPQLKRRYFKPRLRLSAGAGAREGSVSLADTPKGSDLTLFSNISSDPVQTLSLTQGSRSWVRRAGSSLRPCRRSRPSGNISNPLTDIQSVPNFKPFALHMIMQCPDLMLCQTSTTELDSAGLLASNFLTGPQVNTWSDV